MNQQYQLACGAPREPDHLIQPPEDDAALDASALDASALDASALDAAAESPRRPPEDLVQTIKEYADKLAADGSSRGDLKVISRTIRELRYAFKVFAPFRKKRKVTVFGSARTPVPRARCTSRRSSAAASSRR